LNLNKGVKKEQQENEIQLAQCFAKAKLARSHVLKQPTKYRFQLLNVGNLSSRAKLSLISCKEVLYIFEKSKMYHFRNESLLTFLG